MELKERIQSLIDLGAKMSTLPWDHVITKAQIENPWFTEENQRLMLDLWQGQYLTETSILDWVSAYDIAGMPSENKTIGLVLAGNIPMVGFHDVVTTYLSGNVAQIKLSEKDKILIPYLLEVLYTLNPEAKKYFQFVERLQNFDAVIATGSNNTAAHFEYYFRKVPHIIRRNRNGIAALTGQESRAELASLGHDIFSFFGLGCRNVSKIFVPKGYEFESLLSTFDDWEHLKHHNKYKNNLDYNFALFLLNKVEFLQHEVLLLTKSASTASRVGSLHYEFYNDSQEIEKLIDAKSDEIQCIVGQKNQWKNFEFHDFGQAQSPPVHTYADGIDTFEFLLSL